MIFVTGQSDNNMTKIVSSGDTEYLINGSYTAQAIIDERNLEKQFIVRSEPQIVILDLDNYGRPPWWNEDE